MLGLDFWTAASLLTLALVLTFLADWLVAHLQKQPLWLDRGLTRFAEDWLARLVWVALLFAGLAIGVRYLERVENSVAGYFLLILMALLLSLARAALFRRTLWREQRVPAARQFPGWRDLLRTAIYILAGLVLLLGLAGLAGQRLHWPAIAVLALGALLPDLDSQASLLGQALPFLSRPLENRLGHRQAWHTPAVAASLALLGLPLLLGGWQVWIALPLGFVTHLLVDLWRPPGVMILWPVRRTYCQAPGAPLAEPGGHAQYWVAALLSLAAILLGLVVGVGQEPPPPLVTPSFEQTLERYYALRGRTLVYAGVQGTWQASGRRMSGTFEVLNAVGSSFILLDRYTRAVFSAGRSAENDLYLNSISLQTGDTVRVKPAEIRLEDTSLADTLPLLYELQAEPGLQHIYISGDVLLPQDAPGLPIGYSQTSLRRIQELAPGHYSLRYLTAAELISLAMVHVDTADLLLVGTYVVPPSGPTVTPLPAQSAAEKGAP